MALMEWANLKAHELALAADDAVVIAPVAAMEQHGPHLPVQVDSRLATEVSHRAQKSHSEQPTVVYQLFGLVYRTSHAVWGDHYP